MTTEKKDIRQYLHFYLGSECMIGDLNWKRDDISDEDRAPYTDPDYGKPIRTKITLHAIEQFSHKLTPILHRLEDINYAQLLALAKADDFYEYNSWDEAVETAKNIINSNEYRPQTFDWLVSNWFWLFGNDWFDEGLIIDAKTIKP